MKPLLLVGGEAEAIFLRAVLHRLECEVDVETFNPLRDRIGDHRHRVIADHRVGLVRRELPHREPPAFLVLPQERPHEIARPRAIDDRQQWVEGAKGVPQGKHRVVGETVRLVDLEIAPAVLTVDVHIDVRCQHRVIQRRIENGLLVLRSAVHANLREFALPRLVGCLPDGLEVPAWNLRVEILARSLDADCGDANFHQQLPAVTADIERSFQI